MNSCLPLLVFTGAALLFGCSEGAEVSGASEAFVGSCTAERYLAVVSGDRCMELTGSGGSWVPSPLFGGAPEVQSACVFQWSPDEKGAPADEAALRSQIGWRNLAPSCGDAEDVRDDVILEPIDVLDAWTGAGSVSCDVCGVVRGAELFALFPPSSTVYRQVSVPRSDGRAMNFQIHTDPNARVMRINLPALPEGVRYVEGRVATY